VKSYRDVLEDYRLHPEPKFSGTDELTCGPGTRGALGQRRVFLAGTTHMGKETNELESRESGTIHDLDEVLADFGDPQSSTEDLVRDVLRGMGSGRVGKSLSIDRVSVWRALNAGVSPRAARREAFRHHAVAFARAELRRLGIANPMDETDALAQYLLLSTRRNDA
jgi:hypothetical protein